jgi:hypothetical protein
MPAHFPQQFGIAVAGSQQRGRIEQAIGRMKDEG